MPVLLMNEALIHQ